MREDPSSRLPEGYYVEEDADILVLSRPDGTAVACFSTQGASKEAIEQAAQDDRRKVEEK